MIFITKRSKKASFAEVYCELSSQRYNEIQQIDKGANKLLRSNITPNEKYFDSITTDCLDPKKKESLEISNKIRNLKKNYTRQKSANVLKAGSKNKTKDFKVYSSSRKVESLTDRNKTSIDDESKNEPLKLRKSQVKRKLTFTRNQCIPMLINPPKKKSAKLFSISPLKINDYKTIDRVQKKIENNDNNESELSVVQMMSHKSIRSMVKNTPRKTLTEYDEM